MKKVKYAGFILFAALSITSCASDDNPKPVNEEELITTVTTTLTNGANVITLISRDLDGDGPNAPVVTVSGPLALNTEYTGAVTFMNETQSPAEDITSEIEEENTAHQLFFQVPPAIATVMYADTDDNGDPVGLNFTLKTGTAAGTGNLTVTLRHEANKSAAGVADGNIANAGGATDAQVTYPIQISE